ncbi:GNAT family N-acetyltransferase [Streptomyces sp. SP18CS02]|uniref:GNAT family N-acetyltransferase n=1 Tax=Streptomyces sp. SP18CS02 TaxID=3002531 RepID=UPI002E7895A4|nr:GNAT family N-acetyltransferase [Streptomyces sp. SP18CS02]MEE1753363.1 GNAT family N-acetyltransferase [Streptomyces sp. SP18CS02]
MALRNLQPRPATAADKDELVRLRAFLLSTGDGAYVARDPAEDAAWRHGYRVWLDRVLTRRDDRVHVAVIGGPARLDACAIAVVDDRAPTAHCPEGRAGWVQSVVVDPARRRQGLGSRVMAYTLAWLRAQGASPVALQTTGDGARLYRNLGFRSTGEDLLTLDLRGT